jgi:adenosine kinase
MKTLICGSLAFDSIMVFEDKFKNHILPDQIHILNVAFLVPKMRREFGGCAGNIAYSLKLLGGTPQIMATVGEDFTPYQARLGELGLDTSYVKEIPGAFTAQAFITTDLDDNQITAFHPGAMSESHITHISEVDGVSLGIVAPDGRDGMIQHAREFTEQGIPYVFDPGQGLPMFNGEELMSFVDTASYAAMNDYEAKMLQDKTGLKVGEIAQRVDALIVTKGSEGSTIYTKGQEIDIPSARAVEVTDPTGCGDSYRAGLLFGIETGLDWETAGRLASLIGAIKVASRGPQNHTFDRDQIEVQFKEQFGRSIGW